MERITHNPFGPGKLLTISSTLKPFKSREPAEIERVCREILELWKTEIREHDDLLFGLTVGNGEHILKWTGNLEDTFEWDRYRGHNNAQYAGFGFDPCPLDLYMDNPPDFTYGDLLFIHQTLRRLGAEYGVRVFLGTNFEPGPEFCESSFRYVEHPEILNQMGGGHGASIAFDGVFHADTYHYAAYPNGIPEGEPFGRFLGKQMRSYVETFGLDTVSLSNGMGFGTAPWTLNGRNFDGEHWGMIDFNEESRNMAEFWRLFRAEVSCPTSAQGTNWPVGADLATKCIPLKEYYDRNYLGFPLGYTVSVFFNDSVGFAMQSLLSRSSYADSFAVSFYLHDPWYPQDPFDDYPYDGEPYDFYIPMSTALVNSKGEVVHSEGTGWYLHDENGDICPKTARKLAPVYDEAMQLMPDEIGPLTLLYPFDSFHQAAADPAKTYLPHLYFTDCFSASAIDAGLPLNSVCGDMNFGQALQKGTLRDTVLYTPMPVEGAPYVDTLLDWIEKGGRVLFLGSEKHTDDRILKLLGLTSGAALEGELTLTAVPDLEQAADLPVSGSTVLHRPVDSDGGVSALLRDGSDVTPLVWAEQNGERRVYAAESVFGKGKAVWLRGTLPFRIVNGETISYQDAKYYPAQRLARYLLSRFGWRITEKFDTPAVPAQIMFWRHRNGLHMTGYAPDNTLDLAISTPDGAPVLVGYTCELRDGVAHYRIPTTLKKRCHIFVRQQSGKLRCRHIHIHKFCECVYSVTGLEDAEVLIRVPKERFANACVKVMLSEMSVVDKMRSSNADYNEIRDPEQGTIKLSHVTGRLQVDW